MRQLMPQVDLEPIGRIVARDIGFALLCRPILDLLLKFRLGDGDALRAVDLGEAAGQHRLGFIIKRAQQLRLPAVPNSRPDRADVGGGKNGEKLQPLERLHHGGEIFDGLSVGKIARLCDARHHEVLLDQPSYRVGLGRREAEPRARAPRDAGAGNRMVFRPALGDVVQEQRDVKHRAVLRLDFAHEVVRERKFLVLAATRSPPARRCSAGDAHPRYSGGTY